MLEFLVFKILLFIIIQGTDPAGNCIIFFKIKLENAFILFIFFAITLAKHFKCYRNFNSFFQDSSIGQIKLLSCSFFTMLRFLSYVIPTAVRQLIKPERRQTPRTIMFGL